MIIQHAKTIEKLVETCYVMGDRHNKCDMIKLVVSPDGFLCFDLKDNLIGETFFITNSRLIVVKFLQIMNSNGRFSEEYNCIKNITNDFCNSTEIGAENLDTIITTPSIETLVIKNKRNLLDNIVRIYFQQILSIISLAKKSGNLVLGKKRIIASPKNIGIILQAQDASNREKFFSDEKLKIYELFNTKQLSQACGKENTKYLLITNKMAELFIRLYHKYNCYLKV